MGIVVRTCQSRYTQNHYHQKGCPGPHLEILPEERRLASVPSSSQPFLCFLRDSGFHPHFSFFRSKSSKTHLHLPLIAAVRSKFRCAPNPFGRYHQDRKEASPFCLVLLLKAAYRD